MEYGTELYDQVCNTDINLDNHMIPCILFSTRDCSLANAYQDNALRGDGSIFNKSKSAMPSSQDWDSFRKVQVCRHAVNTTRLGRTVANFVLEEER